MQAIIRYISPKTEITNLVQIAVVYLLIFNLLKKHFFFTFVPHKARSEKWYKGISPALVGSGLGLNWFHLCS